MEVRSSRLGIATYLSPDGALIEENLAALEAGVRAARQQAPANLVLDLRHVPFFDSRVLEFLLDLSVELREQGGSLRLAGPTPLCADVLRVTRLNQTIPIFEDFEAAGRSFL